MINKRAHDAITADPERLEGHPVPTPTQVMSVLKTYLSNKKFVLSLGEPCAGLLQYLDFSKQSDGWDPPKASLHDSHPFSNPLNILLDDVDKELTALILRQPEDDRRGSKLDLNRTPATKDFKNLLGYKDYKIDPANRAIDLTKDEPAHPFYAGLGALIDFHDDLIYVACDEGNTPYYLECFQGIATGRKSQDLEMKAAVEASTGKKSLRDIRDAYRAFGLNADDQLTDDSIIGSFQARVVDSSRHEPQLREHLSIIGQHRGSVKIRQFSENSKRV